MLKPIAIFCLLEVSLLPLATFAGSLDAVRCCQGGKHSRQAVVLACQVALAMLGAREELVEVSHSDQQMFFSRVSLPEETWVSTPLLAGAGTVGEAGAGCIPYTTNQPLNWSISAQRRYVCGLGCSPQPARPGTSSRLEQTPPCTGLG